MELDKFIASGYPQLNQTAGHISFSIECMNHDAMVMLSFIFLFTYLFLKATTLFSSWLTNLLF